MMSRFSQRFDELREFPFLGRVAGHRHVTRKIPPDEWAPVLAGLKAPLGVHAILGNHDYWDDMTVQRIGHGTTAARRALEAVGIPVYENDVVRLNSVGRSFWLAGLGTSWPTRKRGGSGG